jgi:hypothetical protein
MTIQYAPYFHFTWLADPCCISFLKITHNCPYPLPKTKYFLPNKIKTKMDKN